MWRQVRPGETVQGHQRLSLADPWRSVPKRDVKKGVNYIIPLTKAKRAEKQRLADMLVVQRTQGPFANADEVIAAQRVRIHRIEELRQLLDAA